VSTLVPLLQELLDTYRAGESSGAVSTAVQGVHFFWALEALPRAPLLYEAGIVVLGQGHKVGYLGDRVFRYDRDSCLIVGVPIPFECESHATPDEPLLGLRVDIDLTLLGELVAKFGADIHLNGRGSAEAGVGVEPAPMTGEMLEATARLLRCLRDPLDSKVLGRAAAGEVIYRALRSDKGRVLYELTQHQTPYAAVSRALDRIHRDYRETISIDELAQDSAMSLSSFHRAFKRVTGDSPLQYLKKIRLEKAKGLLANENMRVNTAAFEVGYESPSQFSREFKRYYKVAPSEARTLPWSGAA
jgi:AraC-like DNA-binding protein